jgi:hypothetical protein
MEGSPPGTEGSCEYIEKAVADRQQGVVLQLWSWAWGHKPLTVKIFLLLRNVSKNLGPGLILWYDLSTGKRP